MCKSLPLLTLISVNLFIIKKEAWILSSSMVYNSLQSLINFVLKMSRFLLAGAEPFLTLHAGSGVLGHAFALSLNTSYFLAQCSRLIAYALFSNPGISHFLQKYLVPIGVEWY